jgi:hypothetical protein
MHAGRPATYDDLLAVPSHLVGELIAGTLHTSPRPSPRHANAAYGRVGVEWAWLVDPVAKLIEVFRHADIGWVRHRTAQGGEAALEPFDAVPFDVSLLWLDG